MIARCRFRAGEGGADPRRPRRASIAAGNRFDQPDRPPLAAPANGAACSRGTARCAASSATRNTPAPVRRLARIARFGARVPRAPTYADAFQEIGPAAIKLGQALATRPDLVGAEAARRSDTPPGRAAAGTSHRGRAPRSSRGWRGRSSSSSPNSIRSRSAPPRSRRSIAPSPPTASRSRSRCCARHSRRISPRRSRPTNGRRRRSRRWAAKPRGYSPRMVIAHFKQWTARELDLRREAASASELRENMVAEPGFLVPAIDWTPHRPAGDDARMDRRHQAHRSRGAGRGRPRSARRWRRPWSAPSCARRSSTASSTPISTKEISSRCRTGGLPRSISGSWAGSTARRGYGLPRSSTA